MPEKGEACHIKHPCADRQVEQDDNALVPPNLENHFWLQQARQTTRQGVSLPQL